MFNVGDYIVHPMHGAGVVEALEKRGEENIIYFVLRLFSGNLKVTENKINNIFFR